MASTVDVKMRFEPSGDLETPYVFEEKVFGGAVPKNYFPAVEKGVQECCTEGSVGCISGSRREGNPVTMVPIIR